jgi:nicotinate-nucleotide--dimethylbenzimidazole phosphoribosyltransferase
MSKLESCLASIAPVDRNIHAAIQAHLDDLTKPQGSLGRLETLAMRYALARGTASPRLARKRICCFAADHGVVAEGVSAYPKEVTPQMVLNMLRGGAAINVLCRHAGAELRVVDMGVDYDFGSPVGLLDRKVCHGTRNFTQGPAMTETETCQAIEAGIALADDAATDGVDLLGTGEMGIANSTPAAALMAVYLGLPVEELTGRGTGVDDEGLRRKQSAIRLAMEVNRQSLRDPLTTLAALGGLEIAGITGLVLGGAARRIPVVVDGFISSSGALAAMRMKPTCADYLFFSHRSAEQGHRAFFDAIGALPILEFDMRLGEGTGAALAMSVIDAAIRIYNEMATFSSAKVSKKQD